MFLVDEVVSIEEVVCDSLRYDITVEDNNNFFANDILVHNCQNLTVELAEWKKQDITWEVTEKLDGSSMTVFVRDGEEGVCSRNLQLKESEYNSMWQVARRLSLIDKIKATGRNLAIQGEIVGEGIQKNRYRIRGQEFFVFDIYDIDAGCYLTPAARQAFVAEHNIVVHVPNIRKNFVIDNQTVADLLFTAEDKSVVCDNGPEREGLVFKCNDGSVSFKAISNKFLIKNGD